MKKGKMEMKRFLILVELIKYLSITDNKQDKIIAIKSARNDGYISADEAIELAIEFC